MRPGILRRREVQLAGGDEKADMPVTKPDMKLHTKLRRTVVVESRYARRWHQTQAAANSEQGVLVISMEELAARLAGGFLRSIRTDSLKISVRESTAAGSLGALDRIRDLPGFQRAAAASLSKVWRAGLTLDGKGTPGAGSLEILEREVRSRLPKNQLPADELANAALERAHYAPILFGRIEIHGRSELSPVWRKVLTRLSRETDVFWMAGARTTPDWLAGSDIEVKTLPAAKPRIRAVSCATPRHEIQEALRWARKHLTEGVPAHRIAIAAASPATWDDHVLAMTEAAKLPVHFIHGKPALTTRDGQLAAALAEVLLRGLSRSRMVRFVRLLSSLRERFRPLESKWWRHLPPEAPLLSSARWKDAIAGLPPESFADGVDRRPMLLNIIEALQPGLNGAAETGEDLFRQETPEDTLKTLEIWQKALEEGPPAALDVTLAGIRVKDDREPGGAIVWGPASAIAAAPRPFCWLVGLTSRSWPRRASEDPLLPNHVVPQSQLDPLPIHESDRRDFHAICSMTDRQVVCSRARRDSEGRLNGVSPLYPQGVKEESLGQSRVPEHAASQSDRLMARPGDFAALPLAQSATRTWIDWRSEDLTVHDGLIGPGHPVLLRALYRTQSASSLVRLLRDPLGYLWTYGFRWKAVSETEAPMTLDALAFGELLHEFLREAVTRMEDAESGGIAGASRDRIIQAVEKAAFSVAERWSATRPVPPPVIWQRKCEEAQELAVIALTRDETPLPGQRTWSEIPFGSGGRAKSPDGDGPASLPWDPSTPVHIDGTEIRIGGFIDRLDLSEDGSLARVTDYKSGRAPNKPIQMNGGAELQRCLYGFAVRSLVRTRPEVEARLVYPRGGDQTMVLDDTQETLKELAAFLQAATTHFVNGKTLSGPAAEDRWYDLSFALPAGAKESYLKTKRSLAGRVLAPLPVLWEAP